MVKTKPKLALRNGPVQPVEVAPPLLKVDLGAGTRKREGFLGCDSHAFPGVDVVMDLTKPWPWPDNSVEEAHCSHTLEHLTNHQDKWERVHFFNELYRVLIPGGKCTIIIPHWASARYYGDPTHKEPFSEWGWLYLNREWRMGNPEKGQGANAPHDDITNSPHGYSCDFDSSYFYNTHPELANRSQATQQLALTFCKEAAQDMVGTVVSKKM